MGGQRLRLPGGNYSMDVFQLGFRDLHVFNTCLPHGKKHSSYVFVSVENQAQMWSSV